MKMKKQVFLPIVLIALVLAVLFVIPAVTMTAGAAPTVIQYANNTYESLTVGSSIKNDGRNFHLTVPSLATVADDGGNKVIKLLVEPAAKPGTVGAEYVVYSGSAYEVKNSAVTISGVSYPVVNGEVTIGETVYTTSTDACYRELRFGGKNVDRNIVVTVGELNYATDDKVYLQADYYISEDAKGAVQSQIHTYSYEDATGKRVDKTWYSLFYLLLDEGGLKSGDSSDTVYGVLDKGAWNTVTVVVDLDNGDREYYVNNRYVFSDTVTGQTNFIFEKNKWVVAKINKNTGNPDELAGYICIDNTKAATYTESDLLSLSQIDERGRYLLDVDVTTSAGRSFSYPYGGDKAPIFCAGGATVTPNYYDFSAYKAVVAPVPGASVRLSHAAGIRFATQLDLDLLERLLALKEEGLVQNISIGTLIAPKTYVERAGAFTVDALNALEGTNAKFVDVKGTIGAYYSKLPSVVLQDGYDKLFVGSLTNIKLGNRAADFSAVGYVRLSLPSGMDVYFYSYEYNANTFGNYSRSAKHLASMALNDETTSYTADQRKLLLSLYNGAADLNLTSSVVKDVKYTSTELFFRNEEGIYCRLTNEGKNGWRLQANSKGYDGFDETGAGQALSMYLGETVESKCNTITVSTVSGVIVVRAEGTDSHAEIHTSSAFALSFYTGIGELASRVTSIETSDAVTTTSTGTIILKGVLEEGEAVYGGGERFDVVNQRGKAFWLYTRDGWNKADSTYMAIPLFVTTRGAGMFVNRYENMAVDFGKEISDEWKITLNNDLMDCYFYATGKMSDALLGYTEISGHSSLPEEWGQGELICRYSPDLSSFEDREEYKTEYASHKLIPDYSRYGANAVGYSKYTAIPSYATYYVQSNTDPEAYKLISENPSSSEYNYNSLYKTDDTGAFVLAFGKVSNRYYALGKTWATLAEMDAFGTFAYDTSIFYPLAYNDDNVLTGVSTSKKNTYVLLENGTYRKMGSKGNPAGDGVKTIVQNLINAGMKPTAMVLEPWSWHSTSSSETAKETLKQTVDWLENACKSDKCEEGACTCTGIKTMLYMGVGGISNGMKGYKPEYQVWATFTYEDGTVERTYRLPRTSGTGENPDVGSSSTQAYIDITNPAAVDWYMNEVWGLLIDIGVDGIKIDFCETMPDEGKYSNFSIKYDWYDSSVFEGDNVHHAYSTYFISLFYKNMIEQKQAKNIPDGFIVLSRGGGIGSQRNPYLWEGDQARTFDKIEDQLIALINSGISGVPFMTYDMAGYQYSGATQHSGITLELESEIFARAIEFTAFTSNIQTHGDVRHAYQMTEEVQEIYRRYTDIHELLIPYIQRYSQIACDTGLPVVRAMVLQYQNDVNVYNLETQYMFGESLLVAPVTRGSTAAKDVYLPEGRWLDLLTGQAYEVGAEGLHLTVAAPLGQLPVFLNVDCSIDDNNLLLDVFNSETWQKINGGVDLGLEYKHPKGDPWAGDIFDD